MILPIVAYGDPVLREKCKEIAPDYPGLQELIDNMFETMYSANGIGLAAPQVDKTIRLFIIDIAQATEEDTDNNGVENLKEVFINACIEEESGKPWAMEEGCLSIPFIREDVIRKEKIRIRYLDRDFREHVRDFDGITARVIQHEYDHTEGILFTDRLKPLKKRLLRKRLQQISRGELKIPYKMRFPQAARVK